MKGLEKIWNTWGREALKFCAWGLAVGLVCFLLSRVVVNHNARTTLVPLDGKWRDSLLAVNVPSGVKDTLVKYDAFEVHFNGGWGIANCTAYELTRGELHGALKRGDDFMEDPAVDGCPSPDAYAGSGLDRGHLVPAADLKWDDQALRQSFLMTNICPMHKALNEGGWAKLEEKVREWTNRDSALLVFTGPVVAGGDSTLAAQPVKVPSHYFKVVLAPCVRPMRALAFIFPNGRCGGHLRQYAVSVAEVERLTGLGFMTALPEEQRQSIKQGVNLDAWLN